MKLETFFEKFDLFADAPDAVEKMRELIRRNNHYHNQCHCEC